MTKELQKVFLFPIHCLQYNKIEFRVPKSGFRGVKLLHDYASAQTEKYTQDVFLENELHTAPASKFP